MFPTDDDFIKLLELARECQRASNHERALYAAAKERMDYKLAAKEPEVVAAGKRTREAFGLADAEVAELNLRFPGLSLFNPAGFVGFSDTLDGYRTHIANSVRDLAVKQWQSTAQSEIDTINQCLGAELDATEFRPGELAFRPTGIIRVSKVFKRVARGVNIHTSQPVPMDGGYKRVDQALADRILALAAARNAYLDTLGLSLQN